MDSPGLIIFALEFCHASLGWGVRMQPGVAGIVLIGAAFLVAYGYAYLCYLTSERQTSDIRRVLAYVLFRRLGFKDA